MGWSTALITGIVLVILAATLPGLPPYGIGLLATVGALLILISGVIVYCGRKSVQPNNASTQTTTRQTVDPKPLFDHGQQWIEELLLDNKEFTYSAFKLIVTVKTKEKTISRPHVVNYNGVPMIADTLRAARAELKSHITQNFASLQLEKIDPGVTVTFVLLTKHSGNKFGVYCRDSL